MKGKYKIVINNKRLQYEFEIKRNLTVIQGDSATGKTTLINMLRQAENLGDSSGINVVCDVPCRVLEGTNWKLILENSSGTIFFTIEKTKNSYLRYNKTRLNETYLHEKNKNMILSRIEEIQF